MMKQITIKKSLLEFAVNYIHMQVAIEDGVYHDQPSLAADMQKLVDDGRLPSGWYDLKMYLDMDAPHRPINRTNEIIRSAE